MKKNNLKLFLIIIFAVAFSLSAHVILKGFVPQEIDEATVLYEYKRIYKTLAPNEPIDLSPLTVTFYTKGWSSKQTYSLPEWGGGGAIGRDDIVVCIDKKPFLDHNVYQVTVHEVVHIAINRICKDISIPRWFHEGLAMTLSGEATGRENIVISKALFTGSLMPLSSIDSVNSFGRFRAELAYCQSRQAVLYLIETYGLEVIAEIVNELKKTGSFWKGFHEVLQLSEQEVESYYRQFVLKHHGRFFWLVDRYLIWVVILFLFITAYFVTYLRIRKKKRLMEQEERNEI